MRLGQTSGKSITQVALDLGIADSTLHHWCKLVAEQGEQAFPGSGHQTALEAENRRLKRELDVTRKARDILKKPSPSSHGASYEVSVCRRASTGVCGEEDVSYLGKWPLCLEEMST